MIGCGLDVAQKSVFYTKNGIMLGHVFQGLNVEGLFVFALRCRGSLLGRICC